MCSIAADTSPSPPLLEVQSLTYLHFGPVDISLAAGHCLGIYGPSGAGKSLLLRALADMDLNQGTVQLEGVAREAIEAPDWRCQVALLPSESAWWFDDTASHLPGVSPQDLAAMGFDADVLTWPVSRLSSGEKQRLALLRALMQRPKLLLLDEPTANLDPDNREIVEAYLQQYLQEQQAAALWVSHDRTQLTRVADACMQLIDGKLNALSSEEEGR